MARTRNYKQEYQRKLELARQRGRKRDYKYEYERSQQKAQSEGFTSPRERKVYKRSAAPKGVPLEAFQRERSFKKFGIKNKAEFDRLRRENKMYFTRNAMQAFSPINRYREDIDSDIHNFSVTRIGYIKAFHDAMVNPETNYQSLKDNPGYYEGSGKARKSGNSRQFDYLVLYSGLMSPEEYAERYGDK